MSGTYLSSKATIVRLLHNDKFVYRSKLLVNSPFGTPEYRTAYRALDNALKELKIDATLKVDVIKSDGSLWYSNILLPDLVTLVENQNTRPEVTSAVNFAFGNPITNKKIYPSDLQSSVCTGYGFAERSGDLKETYEQYSAFTYKKSASPLSSNVFTVRVGQIVSKPPTPPTPPCPPLPPAPNPNDCNYC